MDLTRTIFFFFVWVAVIRKRGSVRAGHLYFFFLPSTPFDLIMVGSHLTWHSSMELVDLGFLERKVLHIPPPTLLFFFSLIPRVSQIEHIHYFSH